MSVWRPATEDPATRIARALSRRRFLGRAFAGITAGAVGIVSTGTVLQGVARAGDRCPCHSPRDVECKGCPSGRKKNKCPDGYQRCRSIDGFPQCPGCTYEQAWWVSCSGLGEGLGYRICVDCWIPDDCETVCGCRSDVICGKCRTSADVRAELALAVSGDD